MPEYTIDDIRGRGVIDTRGTHIGEVDDVSFDPDNWEVNGILVNLRREVADDLHVERRGMRDAQISISRERVRTVGENVMLNVDTDDIAHLLRGSTERETPR